jgi:hypothetical protein
MVPGDGIGPNVCPFDLVGWLEQRKLRLIRKGRTNPWPMKNLESRTPLSSVLGKGKNFSLGGIARKTLRIWLTSSSTRTALSRKYFGPSTLNMAGILGSMSCAHRLRRLLVSFQAFNSRTLCGPAPPVNDASE